MTVHVAFVSARGVRARMAAALFNSMAQRARAVASACALAEPRAVSDAVERAMEELEASALAQECTRFEARAGALVVALGEVAIDGATAWPALPLDDTLENARVVRDDLSSLCVLWVAREGWVDSTERYTSRS